MILCDRCLWFKSWRNIFGSFSDCWFAFLYIWVCAFVSLCFALCYCFRVLSNQITQFFEINKIIQYDIIYFVLMKSVDAVIFLYYIYIDLPLVEKTDKQSCLCGTYFAFLTNQKLPRRTTWVWADRIQIFSHSMNGKFEQLIIILLLSFVKYSEIYE